MWTTRRRTGKVVHTSNIVPKRLAERVWCSKSQSSLLIIYFRSSGFQSSLLLIHFRYGPNTCSYYTEVWHRTYPIWDAWLSRSARGNFTPLQKSPFLGVNTSPMRYNFHFCRRKSHQPNTPACNYRSDLWYADSSVLSCRRWTRSNTKERRSERTSWRNILWCGKNSILSTTFKEAMSRFCTEVIT